MEENMVTTLQEPIMGVLGIGLCFVALFILYRFVQMRNKERLSLIEKGINPSSDSSAPEEDREEERRNGLIMIAIGVGISSGYMLNLFLGVPNFVAYSSMILLLCGAVLLYTNTSSEDRKQ